MLLLTANESKHLSEGMALDKKPAGPRNSFIICPPRPFFPSLPVSSPTAATAVPPLSQISVSVMPLVNYRFVLPFRRAFATFIWPARSGIYRTCEFRRAADLSNYTDISLALIGAHDIGHVAHKRCLGEWTRRASFKCFRAFCAERQKSGSDNHLLWSLSHRCDYKPT